ncbi:MAG: NAD-dependent epimerase/dehydratase family protein [Lachnospiraceae bacterium]|nr:NAD-dependent epimerase/dehydratase family protein [Lachnospiraceae bacterium]
MKRVLCIGGTYFVGRVFTILATRTGEFDITLLNRGRYSMARDHVTEYKFDRNAEVLENPLPEGDKYDAVIDFCAYEPGQLKKTVELFKDNAKQYIFLSTASVYTTDDLSPRCETDPIIHASLTGNEMTDYVIKKALLEEELISVCKECGVNYTILRPTVIFGPFNYAMRERAYFDYIKDNNSIPLLTDAEAKFNMVYVYDINYILQLIAGDERAYNEIFNVASDDVMTHKDLTELIIKCSERDLSKDEYTVNDAMLFKNFVPSLPTQYDELYINKKLKETFGFEYTPMYDAMKKTYDIYMN